MSRIGLYVKQLDIFKTGTVIHVDQTLGNHHIASACPQNFSDVAFWDSVILHLRICSSSFFFFSNDGWGWAFVGGTKGACRWLNFSVEISSKCFRHYSRILEFVSNSLPRLFFLIFLKIDTSVAAMPRR